MKKRYAVIVCMTMCCVALAAQTVSDFTTKPDGNGIMITDYKGKGIAITIPATINGKRVSSIGDYAFYGCTSLSSIAIPASVSSIGEGAFYECTNLGSIAIPASVSSIGADAFAYCTSLSSIALPAGLISIGDYAFYECTSLSSIALPAGLISIGEEAFAYCTSLSSIVIPASVISIGKGAFAGCTSLSSSALSAGVNSIGGSVPAEAQAPSLPPWVDELPPEDVLWGIGVAKQSNISLTRNAARNNAVVEIARQIDNRVKAMFTDYNRDMGTYGSWANLSLQEDVIRTLTNVDLSGAQTERNWTAPDGTYWIRVSYPKANLLKTAEQIFYSEAAQFAEFKADQALAILENELSKSERPQIQSSIGGSVPAADQAPSLPPWIDELPPEDVLWGIGAAKQSSISMSRVTARNRALVEIARQIDSRVKAMFTAYNRGVGTYGSQANLSLQEDVSRTLTNVDLSGAQTERNWTAPDGTYWIRVSYPKANLLKTAEQIFDSMAARYAEFKADRALAILENELSRSERPQVIRD